MQGIQNSLTNYYNEIPKNWKSSAAKQFGAGFLFESLFTRNFKAGLKFGFYCSLAETVHSLAYPLLKKMDCSLPYASQLSGLGLKNFIVFTGFFDDFYYGLKVTSFSVAFNALKILSKPYVAEKNLQLLLRFSFSFERGMLIYKRHEKALKAAFISVVAEKFLNEIHPYLTGKKQMTLLERAYISGCAITLVSIYERPLSLSALTVGATLFLLLIADKVISFYSKELKKRTGYEFQDLNEDNIADALKKYFHYLKGVKYG